MKAAEEFLKIKFPNKRVTIFIKSVKAEERSLSAALVANIIKYMEWFHGKLGKSIPKLFINNILI